MLTDENAAKFLEKLGKQDRSIRDKLVSWLKDLAQKLQDAVSAYKDVSPDSVEGWMVANFDGFRENVLGLYMDALADAGENYRENGGDKNTTLDSGEYEFSIRRTQKMSWEEQVRGALYSEGNIRRNDTLIVGGISDTFVKEGVSDIPLAIPISVLRKAMSGKDISHSIKRGKLALLNEGIRNSPIVVVNPERNSIVYVTNIKQGGYPVIAAFSMNTMFDGDYVHKATSIHIQIDVQTMLRNLPDSATIYVLNKNELETVGATNNLRGLSANIKFIEVHRKYYRTKTGICQEKVFRP